MTSRRNTKTRSIAVVTGTRAEYGLLRSTMEAIRDHPKLRLQVVVAGMHLLKKFGNTAKEITGDGWHIDARIRMQVGDDSPLDQAKGLGRGVAAIAKFLELRATDVVVVLGDRIEALAGALAAVTTGRLVGHVHGGDVASGDFDDPVRDAITKLAHVHFTATGRSTRRVIRMGEESRRVHCVGAPGIDRLVELVASRGLRQARSGKAMVVQHACGRSAARERSAMRAILRAVDSLGLAKTIIYPNSDRGHTGIIEAIEEHRRRRPINAVTVVRSLDRDAYLLELMESDVLVGNSSSGIIEAAVAGTAAVNVGLRQRGREKSGPSVIDSDETCRSILGALERALRKRPRMGVSTVYGSGQAGAQIAGILARIPLDDAFRSKSIVQ